MPMIFTFKLPKTSIYETMEKWQLNKSASNWSYRAFREITIHNSWRLNKIIYPISRNQCRTTVFKYTKKKISIFSQKSVNNHFNLYFLFRHIGGGGSFFAVLFEVIFKRLQHKSIEISYQFSETFNLPRSIDEYLAPVSTWLQDITLTYSTTKLGMWHFITAVLPLMTYSS